MNVMKMNNNQQPIIEIENEQLQQLCSQVQETIAADANIKNIKHHFGVADLWNIQRVTRYRVQRRHLIQ
jgi:hypothetical protein